MGYEFVQNFDFLGIIIIIIIIITIIIWINIPLIFCLVLEPRKLSVVAMADGKSARRWCELVKTHELLC